MADHRLNASGIKPGINGDVLTTLGGVAAWASPASPATGTPIVCIDENGAPGLVFDDDGQIVYTEG